MCLVKNIEMFTYVRDAKEKKRWYLLMAIVFAKPVCGKKKEIAMNDEYTCPLCGESMQGCSVIELDDDDAERLGLDSGSYIHYECYQNS